MSKSIITFGNFISNEGAGANVQYDGPDGKDVANVGIVQYSTKQISKIQKNVQYSKQMSNIQKYM
jgi:hypothetical protein